MSQESRFELLDGATGAALEVVQQVRDLREIARDSDQPLEQRLEAFEDIIDSEIGDTNLVRARNMEREMGFRQL